MIESTRLKHLVYGFKKVHATTTLEEMSIYRLIEYEHAATLLYTSEC